MGFMVSLYILFRCYRCKCARDTTAIRSYLLTVTQERKLKPKPFLFSWLLFFLRMFQRIITFATRHDIYTHVCNIICGMNILNRIKMKRKRNVTVSIPSNCDCFCSHGITFEKLVAHKTHSFPIWPVRLRILHRTGALFRFSILAFYLLKIVLFVYCFFRISFAGDLLVILQVNFENFQQYKSISVNVNRDIKLWVSFTLERPQSTNFDKLSRKSDRFRFDVFKV